MRLLAAALALAALLSDSPPSAWAQAIIRPEVSPTDPLPTPLPAAGWYLIPAFSIGEEYDDNVFVSSSQPQSDFITRFTPGIQLGYRSEPLTFLVSASFDAEIYAKNPDLNSEAVRKRAALEFRYLPYRLLTVGLDVNYIDTQTPTELVPTTGLQLTRSQGTELNVTPAVAYQLTPRDTVKATYSFRHDTLEGSPSADTHRGWLSLVRQFTPLDTGSINYRYSAFHTEGAPTTTSHTPTIGWIRQFTPTTLVTLQGGPRFVQNGGPQGDSSSVQPEVHARLDQTFRLLKVGLDYLRTEGFVIGRPGSVEEEVVSGLLEGEPLKLLKLRFEPSYARTFGGVDPTARVYGFLLTALYPIQPWVAARLNYRFAYQDQGGTTLQHNVVTLSLDFNYPIRIAE